MKSYLNPRTNRLFIRFLISYIVVLSVPLVSMAFLSGRMSAVVRERAISSAAAQLANTQETTDGHLRNIERTAYHISTHRSVRQLMARSRPLDGGAYFDVWTVIRDLSRFKLTDDVLVEFYVFFYKNGIVISHQTSFIAQDYYGAFFEYGGLSRIEWERRMIFPYSEGRFFAAADAALYGESRRVVVYAQTVPIGFPGRQDGKLLLLLDERAIAGSLARMDLGDAGGVFVIDDAGTVITGVGNQELARLASGFAGSDDHFRRSVTVDGMHFTVVKTISDFNRWSYIAIVPTDHILGQVRALSNAAILFSLFAFVSGGILAYSMLHHNLRPLKDLVGVVRRYFRREMTGSEDEIGYIASGLRAVLRERVSLQREIVERRPFVRAAVLDRLLHGFYDDEDETRRILAHVGIDLSGVAFLVVMIRIGECKDNVGTQSLQDLDERRVLVERSLEDLIPSTVWPHHVDKDTLSLVLSFLERQLERWEHSVEKLVSRIASFLMDKYSLHVRFGVGSVYGSISQIHLSCGEALEALAYAGLTASVGWHQPPLPVHDTFEYPLDFESRLISTIRAGNVSKTEELLHGCLENNVVKRALGAAMTRQFLRAVCTTLVRAQTSLGGPGPDRVAVPLADCDGERRSEEVFGLLIVCARQIAEAHHERRILHRETLVQSVTEYIERSFADPQLSRSSVAMHFGISETYLSQLFSEQTEDGFFDYLERTRMVNARSLLSSTELSVYTVAERVGYHSDKTFRRAFKRFQGVTPTEYRRATTDQAENRTSSA